MQFWIKDGDFRALKSTRMTPCDRKTPIIHTGRNMTSSWQLLVREITGGFTIEKITFSGIPDGVTVTPYIQGYITYNDGTPYPDILLPFEKTEVLPNCTQGIVFVVKTDENAPVCSCAVCYTVTVSGMDYSFYASLNIHPATVPLPENSAFDCEYFFRFGINNRGDDNYQYRLNPYYDGVDKFSDRWREVMKNFALAMKELRVNSLWLNSVPLLAEGGSRRTGKDSWSLDFSRFDEFAELFLKYGSFKYISITAIIKSKDGEYINAVDENGHICQYKIYSEDAESWAEAYLVALRQHFIEKGWLDKLIMHIEDEPHQIEYWNWYRAKIKQFIPETNCLEPIDKEKIGSGIADGCDILVPRIEIFEHEKSYYQERAEDGKNRLWCYSCCYPEEPWFLNKFIDLPQSYSRLMSWACFSNHISGFLHWGFNQWTGDRLRYGMHPDSRFKGDGFIVYPDVEHNSVILSNRALATTEGLEDCELLAQLADRDIDAAYGIANGVARSFCDFNTDDGAAEEARAKVLALL